MLPMLAYLQKCKNITRHKIFFLDFMTDVNHMQLVSHQTLPGLDSLDCLEKKTRYLWRCVGGLYSNWDTVRALK